MKCQADPASELDRNNIDMNGTCTYTYGEECSYVCRRGYFSGKSMRRGCSARGLMVPNIPKCEGQYLKKVKKTL